METGAADKKVVRVVIFQQPYTLRSAGEPGETESLAAAVDYLMNQVASRAGTGDAARIAVLTALHLADQVRHLEQNAEAARTQLGVVTEARQEQERRVGELEGELTVARSGRTVDTVEHERLRKRVAEMEARLREWKERAGRLADLATRLGA